MRHGAAKERPGSRPRRFNPGPGWVLALALAAAPVSRAAAAAAELPVDLELVLAVDASTSINRWDYVLEMRGLAEAFRHPAVVQAIRTHTPRGLAVALMQWAGTGEQLLVVDWQLVHDRASAEAMAREIDIALRLRARGGTAIGNAMIAASRLLETNNYAGFRRVIDVSGDGHANEGTPPLLARDAIVARGTTINGLAILNEAADLDRYYAENVIGGAGSFVVPANDFSDFAVAIRHKLIREIGGMPIAADDTRFAARRPPRQAVAATAATTGRAGFLQD